MSTMRRRVREESGIALPLAIMVMVLVGVMGAGLLTFVMTDLDSVVATNQGQRAFEMADAGVAVAKQQLLEDSDAAKYNDTVADNLPWASTNPSDVTQDGVILSNLDGSDATADSVLVEISSPTPPDNSFKVISTGRYGDAKRRIEAVFSVPSSSGDNSGDDIELRSWRELYE